MRRDGAKRAKARMRMHQKNQRCGARRRRIPWSCVPTQPLLAQPLRTECARRGEVACDGMERNELETSKGTHENAPKEPTVRRDKAAHTVVVCPHPKSALARRAEDGLGG